MVTLWQFIVMRLQKLEEPDVRFNKMTEYYVSQLEMFVANHYLNAENIPFRGIADQC